VDPDGMIRMVVSRQNPGVANWIETTGKQRGIAQFRWQRADRELTESDGPAVEIVNVADVPSRLPYFADNTIDDAGWQDRIAARQRGFAQRMLG
jgi:hypothetical protein